MQAGAPPGAGVLGFILTLAHPHSSLPKPGWRVLWRWGTLASPGASHASGAHWRGVRGAGGLLCSGDGRGWGQML